MCSKKTFPWISLIFIIFLSLNLYAESEPKILTPPATKSTLEIPSPPLTGMNAQEIEYLAFQKMSSAQIKQYLITKTSLNNNRMALYIPISMFAIIPLCFLVLFFYRNRIIREKQITLRTMVENGAQIPPEMFLESGNMTNQMDKDRRRGLLFSLSSLGLIFFLTVIEDSPEGLWALGLIPFLLGVGYLLSWRLASLEKARG